VDFQTNSSSSEEIPGRILALDVGRKRIGLALSDPLGITAQGLPTLQRTTLREDIAAVQKLAEQQDVGVFLVGYPLHLSGDESRQSVYTREFAEKLESRTGIHVRYWDERLTSVEANRVLKDSGISIEKRAKAVDRLAAVILLESYLDARHLLAPVFPEEGMNPNEIDSEIDSEIEPEETQL
jgi:putative Holliday junction resolvase